MKQEITQEQFEELSPEQATNYLTWLHKKSDVVSEPSLLVLIYKGTIAPPGRSIGQLIWFLDEHITGEWWNIEREGSKKGWRVQAKYTVFDENDMPELIDMLWEAVKTVLT
jgi:hypothetical protein